MGTECILSDYLDHAMAAAAYDKLDDGTFARPDTSVQRDRRLWDLIDGVRALVEFDIEGLVVSGIEARALDPGSLGA